MLFKEIMVVYSEDHTDPIHSLQNTALEINLAECIITTRLQKIKGLFERILNLYKTSYHSGFYD
jgi:hypothetical protein